MTRLVLGSRDSLNIDLLFAEDWSAGHNDVISNDITPSAAVSTEESVQLNAHTVCLLDKTMYSVCVYGGSL